ncbi:MAG: hypothetical protein FWE98_05655 [Oscillospiraceae bacterium]|nr:hypothetical protein [Oscillospiraceae bacterium]
MIPYIQEQLYTALAALSLFFGAGAVLFGLFAKKARRLFYAIGGALCAAGLAIFFFMYFDPTNLFIYAIVAILLMGPALLLAGALAGKARKPLLIAGGIVSALELFIVATAIWQLFYMW